MVGCCGPQSMIEDFEQATRGWPDELVHIERFAPLPMPPDPNEKQYTLVLSRSRLEVAVTAGQTILSALIDAGVWGYSPRPAAEEFAVHARWTGFKESRCIAIACCPRRNAGKV